MQPQFNSDESDSRPRETSEETIHRVLSGYELGRKLRQLRLKKKLGLVELGRHTGLSASMLSQLENGKLIPTLPTLARIAMVFDVGLEHFFGDSNENHSFHLVRAAERIRFPERPEVRSPGYFFESLAFSAQNKGLQGYWADFPPREEYSQAHTHEGQELIFVLDGSLNVQHSNIEYVLYSGDSAFFDASLTHAYRGESPQGARALVVTTAAKPGY